MNVEAVVLRNTLGRCFFEIAFPTMTWDTVSSITIHQYDSVHSHFVRNDVQVSELIQALECLPSTNDILEFNVKATRIEGTDLEQSQFSRLLCQTFPNICKLCWGLVPTM